MNNMKNVTDLESNDCHFTDLISCNIYYYLLFMHYCGVIQWKLRGWLKQYEIQMCSTDAFDKA